MNERTYTIDTSPAIIRIDGKEFTLQTPAEIALIKIRQFIDRCASLDEHADRVIEDMLRTGCDLADSLLGEGACFQVFGSNPISIGNITAMLLLTFEDCSGYVSKTYKFAEEVQHGR